MITRTYHIEFLTPCFCAGACQTRAELRPPSIRGQLRWWFRCIGGTPNEEQTVFGGVRDKNPLASSFVVRVRQQPSGGQKDWEKKIPGKGVGALAYLQGFFCDRTGRLQPHGAIPPGSTAVIELLFKTPPTPRLEQSLRLFFSIGAIGFRATRAAGAIASREHQLTPQSWKQLELELAGAGFTVHLLDDDFKNDWAALLLRAGNLLKHKLRGKNGGLGVSSAQPSPLGSPDPRQASALLFRPVRIDGHLRLALIEAPHDRVLDAESRRTSGETKPLLNLALHKSLIR